MKIENIRLERVPVGLGYAMVFCDVVLSNGQVIDEVAENIATNGLDIELTDSNIEHNEDRLTDDQKQEVMQALSKWYTDRVTALDNYCNYMNKNYDKDFDWCFTNGELLIDDCEISSAKLEEIKDTSGSDYFNIELDD